MAVTFVIGRAGSGKTHFCIERAASHLAAGGDDHIILLVPEQASFQMERTLAQRTACGGFWRAEVLSFTRLARRVAAELGISAEPLTPDARRFALRYVLARAEPQLGVLRPFIRKPGFLLELSTTIEEWLAERVTPDELRSAVSRLADSPRASRLRELVLIFDEYCRWLKSGAPDPAQRLDALRDQLPRLAWLRNAHVFADGFAGFTGQEFETLGVLAANTRSLTLTLLIDPRDPVIHDRAAAVEPLGLFSRIGETYGRLLRTFRSVGVEINAPIPLDHLTHSGHSAQSAFAARETALVSVWSHPRGVITAPKAPIGNTHVVECETPRDELRAAAAAIRRSVAESGGTLRYRDCAIITRDLEPIAELCKEVFADFEIPFFLDRRRTLRSHPLALLVTRLWEAVRTDLSTDSMLALLRTDLLPLQREETEALQQTAAAYRPAGVDVWSDDWPKMNLPGALSQQLRSVRQRLIAALEPLRKAAAAESQTGRAWAEAFHAVLQAMHISARLTHWMGDALRDGEREKAETHRLAWSALCGALQQLHTTLHETPLPVHEAASLMTQSICDATVGLTPPMLDQVLVSAIERSRHPEIRRAWLIGFNEGAFPARPMQPVLLTNADRAELRRAGIENVRTPDHDVFAERLLAYIAMTRPTESLTISYSRLGLNGDERLPSPFLADVRRALGVRTTTAHADDAPPASINELARRLLINQTEKTRLNAIVACVSRQPELAAKLQYMRRGREYENCTQPIVNGMRTIGPSGAWRLAVSDVESYLQCPFQYFASRQLRLNPYRGPRPIEWQLGEAAHGILAAVVGDALGEPPIAGISDDRWLEFLDRAVRADRESLGPSLDIRRPQSAFLHELLYRRLRDVVLTHAERWRRGSFEPAAVEVPLDQIGSLASSGTSRKAQPKPFEITLTSGETIEISGRIDRVDRIPSDVTPTLALYDFKTRAQSLKTKVLVSPILQMFLYAAALRAAGYRVGGVFIAPWSIASANKTAAFEAADATTQRLLLLRPKGLVDQTLLSQFDRELANRGDSAVIGVRLTMDGKPYSNSDAAEASKIDARCAAAVDSVGHAAIGIADGAIPVSPLVVGRRLACLTCDFQPLCRFERGLNPIRNAETTLPSVSGASDEEAGDEAGV